MDRNPSPSKGPRISKEAQTHQECSVLQTRKHRLCNELVCEVCKEIPLIGTADDILLTALNIRTYLAKRFRKKVIYREAIAFIKAVKKQKGKGIGIQIDRGAQINESEHVLIHQNRHQSDNSFELRTNHLRLRMKANNWAHGMMHNIRFVDESQFGNAHMHFFLRLIAPLLQPIELNLSKLRGTTTCLARFLSALSGCGIHLVQLNAEQFLSLHYIHAPLADFNNLEIHRLEKVGLDEFPQFCLAFNHWLTAKGKSKNCMMYIIDKQRLALLLDEVKADFSRATSRKSPFTVRMRVHDPNGPKPPFSVRNGVGEKLELRRRIDGNWVVHYTLIRRPIAESGDNNPPQSNRYRCITRICPLGGSVR